MPSGDLVAIDAHVHLHDEREAMETLEAASRNFSRHAPGAATAVCMLAERDGFDVFSWLRTKLRATAENESLWFDESHRLLIVAGRQIESSEGLEVLGLALGMPLQLEGRPAHEIIAALRTHDSLPVLPWGAGKWLGSRGHLVDRLLDDEPGLFLGDNGGRPGFWPVPRFRRGVRVLPGSDPLPLPGASSAIGSFGCLITCDLPADRPASALRRALRDPASRLLRFGRLTNPLRFAIDQTRLRAGNGKAVA